MSLSDLLALAAVIVAVGTVRWTDNAYARYWCGLIAIFLVFIVLCDVIWSYAPWPKGFSDSNRFLCSLLVIVLAAIVFSRLIFGAIGSYPNSADFYSKSNAAHSEYAKELMLFYAEGSAIRDEINAKESFTCEEMGAIDKESQSFLNKVSEFLALRMGETALMRFKDFSEAPRRWGIMNAKTPDVQWRIDRQWALSEYLKNLQRLAESKIYEQKH